MELWDVRLLLYGTGTHGTHGYGTMGRGDYFVDRVYIHHRRPAKIAKQYQCNFTKVQLSEFTTIPE